MLYPVCLLRHPQSGWQITVPDFGGLRVTDAGRQRALTRIHLLIEGAVSQLLLDGDELPRPSDMGALKQQTDYADKELLLIDINPVHLAAVARHQAGR